MAKRSAAMLVLLVGLARAQTGEVSLEASSRETQVGVPVQLLITIRNAEKYEAPQLPEIDGAEASLTGRPSESSRVSIINGRMTQEVTVTFAVHVTPTREGTIRVPPIPVLVDGKTRTTAPLEIVAVKSEATDLLFVEVKGSRETLYVGESLDVTLEVWLKPFSDPRQQITLTEADMWSLIDQRSSTWGLFTETLQELAQTRQRPKGAETLRNDAQGNRRSYYRYDVRQTLWPQQAGTLDVGRINIIVSYPTNLVRERDFFSTSRMRLGGSRPVSASVSVPPIQVKPIPTEGQPPFYRGAVGRSRIEVAAQPTEVAVGDPITLTMTLSGPDNLDLLQAPALAQVPELTADFQVPDENLAGSVEGKGKRFTQSIRAKSDAVTRIPPIPLAWFDPKTEKFEVVYSKPIPLTVKPAQRMAVSQIVEGAAGPAAPTRLTELTAGILANYTDADAVLSDQSFAPGAVSAGVAALSPAAFLICWFVRRHTQRLREDPRYARRRAAYRTAMRAIAAASGSSGPAEQVAGAVLGYVADRCNLPTGGLTRVEARNALTTRKVAAHLVAEMDTLLNRCDDIRYAGGGSDATGDLVNATKQCISALERQRW